MYVEKRIAESGSFELRVHVSDFGTIRRAGSGAGADLDVGDSRVAIFRAAARSSAALLPLEFRLNSQRLHLVHFADGFPQVLRELASVVLVTGVECD